MNIQNLDYWKKLSEAKFFQVIKYLSVNESLRNLNHIKNIITNINERNFKNNYNLTSVTIPSIGFNNIGPSSDNHHKFINIQNSDITPMIITPCIEPTKVYCYRHCSLNIFHKNMEPYNVIFQQYLKRNPPIEKIIIGNITLSLLEPEPLHIAKGGNNSFFKINLGLY